MMTTFGIAPYRMNDQLQLEAWKSSEPVKRNIEVRWELSEDEARRTSKRPWDEGRCLAPGDKVQA